MGIALWIAAGLVAFGLARFVPSGRRRPWLGELATSIVAGFLLGIAATALDFGGWREPDWRAGLFALLGALSAVGVFRLVSLKWRA
jgi:hypothetical protein